MTSPTSPDSSKELDILWTIARIPKSEYIDEVAQKELFMDNAEALIALAVQEAERKGYDNALAHLLEWNEYWSSQHTEPFNWYGAIKALQVSKKMQLPFVQFNPNHKGETK